MPRKLISKRSKVTNHLAELCGDGGACTLRYKFCVSGGAETGHCASDAIEKAEVIGREIAKRGLVLVTGATSGIPYWAAKGAKAEGGIVIGISPASSKEAHLKTYRLPVDYHDLIIYTGFEYSGRNLLLIRSSDAVISICGRMGTLNEFTIAFEDKRPIGALEGTGGSADMIRNIIKEAHRGPGQVVYSSDPSDLIDQVLTVLQENEIKSGVKDRRF